MLVICNGMERAGSTCQYSLTRLLIQTSGIGKIHPYTGAHTDTWPLPNMREWAADEEFHLVKLHKVHKVIPEAIQDGRLRIIYVYRDVRDVAASLRRVRGLRGDRLVERIDTIVGIYRKLVTTQPGEQPEG